MQQKMYSFLIPGVMLLSLLSACSVNPLALMQKSAKDLLQSSITVMGQLKTVHLISHGTTLIR